MNRPVLLITSNHTLQPLWAELYKHWDLCIIGPSNVSPQDLGMENSFSIAKYNNPEISEIATNIAYELAAKLYDSETSASLCSRISGQFGDSLPNEFKPEIVKRWWPAMMGEHIKQGVTLIELLKAVMAEREVSACVVHEDVTHDMRVMVQYCKSRGIPTFHIPHANCMYVGKEWDIHTESISDWILAGGTFAGEFYMKWGYPGKHIRITGMPQLDSWYGPNPPSRKECRAALGVKDDEFLIIYASSWGQLTSTRGGFEDEFRHNIDLVMNAAKEMKATLCIKMHPGEAQNQEQMYLNEMKNRGVNGFLMRQYNEYALRAGDVLIAHGPSNICVQAAIIGLSSCYLPTEGFDFPFGPNRVDGDLPHAIGGMMQTSKETWNDFAKAMNDAHPSGGACERVAETIVSIV